MLTDNSLKGLQAYFRGKLSDQFTEREITIFFEWSCASLFDLSKSDILLNDRKLSESEILMLRTVAKRLLKNEPIQYILEEAQFMDLIFTVTPDVLIPRPETEELVSYLIEEQISGRVLDIGTGSGIIPITIKSKFSHLEVHAVDVSQKAIEVARLNAEKNRVEVNFIQMDVLNEELTDIYDVIVSNPPYVLESDKLEMLSTVLDYEPHLALFVPNEDPLKFYKRILKIAKKSLRNNGLIAFEIHENYGNDIAALLSENGFEQISIIQDMQQKDRIIKGIKKARQ